MEGVHGNAGSDKEDTSEAGRAGRVLRECVACVLAPAGLWAGEGGRGPEGVGDGRE